MLKKHADRVILITAGILIILGLAVLASASSELGKIKFDDSYYYLKHQLIHGLSFGVAGFLAALLIPYKFFQKAALPLLLLSVVALILVFSPLGAQFGSAARWLEIGPLTIQPSEILKFTFIVYLAAWLTSRYRDRKNDFMEGFLPFIIISGIIAVLLVLQPSTSIVAILMLTGLIMYFVNGARLSYILFFIFIGILGFCLIVYLYPYRLERITSFLNPEVDPLGWGARYHLNQARIAIGSGGLFGVGYGNSIAKVKFLPEPIGDSIFVIIAEELGFVGALFFIFMFFVLTMAGLVGSQHIRNRFGRLAVMGFSSLIAIQVFVHIGSVSGLIPLTGIPLPFISYGGTAMAVFMTMTGLTVNLLRNA